MLINWFTVAAQIVNFLILLYLLKRFLYKPILRAMEERERRIASAMEETKKAEEAAQRKARELEEEKRAFLEAKEQLMFDAKKEVEAWRDRTMQGAKSEIDDLRRSWQTRLDEDKRGFVKRLKSDVAGHIMRISEKTLQDLANRDLEHEIVSVFLKKAGEDSDLFPPEDLPGAVVVRSGFDLDEHGREAVHGFLDERLKGGTEFRFEVLKDLGMGIQVMVGDLHTTLCPDTGWNGSVEFLEHFFDLPQVTAPEGGCHQAHTTVDVKTDTAGRDDALVHGECPHAADGEPVSPVNVRHCKGMPADAGKGGDVCKLCHRPFFEGPHQFL